MENQDNQICSNNYKNGFIFSSPIKDQGNYISFQADNNKNILQNSPLGFGLTNNLTKMKKLDFINGFGYGSLMGEDGFPTLGGGGASPCSSMLAFQKNFRPQFHKNSIGNEFSPFKPMNSPFNNNSRCFSDKK